MVRSRGQRRGGQQQAPRADRSSGDHVLDGALPRDRHKLVVRADSGGQAVGQRVVAARDGRGGIVERGAPRRRHVAEDRRPGQAVGEGDRQPRGRRLELHEATGAQLVHRDEGVAAAGHAGDVVDASHPAQHRQRRPHRPGTVATPGQLGDHQVGVGARDGERRQIAPGQGVEAELGDEGTEVQRIATGMVVQAGHRPRRDGPAVGLRRQLAGGGAIEWAELESQTVADQALEAGGQAVHAVVTAPDAQQDGVAVEASHREGQRPERGLVGPLGVVDHDHERLIHVHPVDQPQQIGTDVDGVCARPEGDARLRGAVERRSPHQLCHDAVGEVGLRLVTGGGDHHRCGPIVSTGGPPAPCTTHRTRRRPVGRAGGRP